MKKLRLILLIGLLAAIGMGTLLISHPEWVRINTVDVTMAADSNQQQLFQNIRKDLAPKLKRYQGRYFWQVPLNTLRELIAADRRVLSVNIYREFPSRLKIEIVPRDPVMVFLDSRGRLYPVGADGALLPPTKPDQATGLPVIRGPEFVTNSDLRDQAIQLFQMVPDKGLLDKQNISEIFYSSNGGFEMFLSNFDSEVKIGKTDFGPKISRIQKVLFYLNSRHIKGRVIDARFSKKVVVRVRNTP